MAAGKRDRARFDAMVDLMVRAGGKWVKVGIFDGKAGATSETVKIATIHEYGAPRAAIPERSFIRATFRERKQEIALIMGKIVRKMLAGQLSEYDGLSLIGAWLSNAIKTKITHGPFVPLKPRTIARKGSDVPLIDTAQMKNSVTFVIVE